MSLLNKINKDNLPKHIAVIMDGNGRWAKKKGNARIFGHKHGVNGVRETSEACAELGVDFLTLYAFSTENWNRPKLEVNALMELLISSVNTETKILQKNNIRLKTIGNVKDLPAKTLKKLEEAIDATKNNTGLTLILALSYSSKTEIIEGIKSIAQKVKSDQLNVEDISEELLSKSLYTRDYPDPDLMIRTSGEQRISNFLMWQLAYSELYFTDTLWPDFNKEELYKAILAYQNRERRFGKTSEQLKTQLP